MAELRESSIQINEQDLRFLLRRLKNVAKELRDDDWRREVTGKAAQFVVGAARSRTPRSRRDHYVYKTASAKIIKGRRAKRNSVPDSLKTLYKSGNLQFSIQFLEKLKKTNRAVIGPRILRRARAKSYGSSPRRSNGFYAQFLYGSAQAFRDRIMVPALVSQSPRIRSYIDRRIEQRLGRAKRKNKFAA